MNITSDRFRPLFKRSHEMPRRSRNGRPQGLDAQLEPRSLLSAFTTFSPPRQLGGPSVNHVGAGWEPLLW
jgi:hypothetical protein